MSTYDDDKYEQLAKDILYFSRNSLVVNLRFMDVSISRLKLISVKEVKRIYTDGIYIAYNPIAVLRQYKEEKNSITRTLLHSILHCVFQHFFVDITIRRHYWDLATDIAIENIINELDFESVNTSIKNNQIDEIEKLKKNIKYITAEHIYRFFVDRDISDKEIKRLTAIFQLDEHDVWYDRELSVSWNLNDNSESVVSRGVEQQYATVQNIQAEWKNIAEHIQIDLQSFGKMQGKKAGSLTQNLLEVNREKYDYSAFLKKFATMGEVMKVNDDEFDYIFYTYGLKMYKKMPLIEPLEYKDVKRIKEFVIAIDTSGSTSGELVQRFVEKTYNILKQEESFFSKINLHIIQCDAEIQEDYKITCPEEFDQYLKSMKIRGLGGTDFRPVFGYVNELIEKKEFQNLKGLIYFTDGYGTFPSKQPEYYTAVVYIDDEYNNPQVPVWAIKLVLKPEEI